MKIIINAYLIVSIILITMVSQSYGFEIKKEDYNGDGKFIVKVRDYGVGRTYGYDIQFEPFVTNNNIEKHYSINLPSTNNQIYDQYDVNFEIVIGTPKSRSELNNAVVRSNNMPKEHEIYYKLIDSKTKEVIKSGNKSVCNLESTHNYEYKQMGLLHMKNLFGLSQDEVSKHKELEFDFKYLINGVPSEDKVFIYISLMAPTA